jgi:hypothetical protein
MRIKKDTNDFILVNKKVDQEDINLKLLNF